MAINIFFGPTICLLSKSFISNFTFNTPTLFLLHISKSCARSFKQWRAVTFETSHAIGMPKPGHKIVFIQDQFLSKIRGDL